ncbi:MAG: hypothetical protein U1E14_21335 [Geminicoccaceae bacterium]
MRLRAGIGIAGAALALIAGGAAPSRAGSLVFDDSVSACTGTNCSSVRIPGTVGNPSPNSLSENAEPFILQVFAAQGECLRLDVTAQDRDLYLVAVSPRGTLWKNESRAATDSRPLLKIASAPERGWYTVHIGVQTATLYSNFILSYGRYNAGNPNCAAGSTSSPGGGGGGGT